ncbi:MAG: ABC transporter permease [Candidatus Heimdallarchaeota archaeon]|nr:ABC transporter permease [Candidatus Heimdallarchaeota archaeon]
MVNTYLESKSIDIKAMDMGSSKNTSSLKIVLASIKLNMIYFIRYRADYVGAILEIVILTASFFLFSQVINFRSDTYFNEGSFENGLFIFFLSGMTLMLFQNTALYKPVNTINRDLYNGTLEYLFSGPQSRYAYLLGNIIGDIIIRQIFTIPMLILLFWLTGITIHALYLLGLMLVFFIFVTSVGVLVSLMAITWKQIGNIVGILGILVQFLGGVFLPVQSFPVYIQWIAMLVPFTYAFDLARYHALQGNWTPILPLQVEWTVLIISGIFFFWLSRYLLLKVERYAKNEGLHLL